MKHIKKDTKEEDLLRHIKPRGPDSCFGDFPRERKRSDHSMRRGVRCAACGSCSLPSLLLSCVDTLRTRWSHHIAQTNAASHLPTLPLHPSLCPAAQLGHPIRQAGAGRSRGPRPLRGGNDAPRRCYRMASNSCCWLTQAQQACSRRRFQSHVCSRHCSSTQTGWQDNHDDAAKRGPALPQAQWQQVSHIASQAVSRSGGGAPDAGPDQACHRP